jgi:hypothetical protein
VCAMRGAQSAKCLSLTRKLYAVRRVPRLRRKCSPSRDRASVGIAQRPGNYAYDNSSAT